MGLPRWGINRDTPQLLAIEKQCFGENGWTEEDFTEARRNNRTIIRIVEDRNDIIYGYVCYHLTNSTQMQIVRIVIKPEMRRQGEGSRLIEYIIRRLVKPRMSVTYECDERNVAAQLFLKKLGFICVKIHSQMNSDDTYIMERDISQLGWTLTPVNQEKSPTLR